jgi:hypothetical protein
MDEANEPEVQTVRVEPFHLMLLGQLLEGGMGDTRPGPVLVRVTVRYETDPHSITSSSADPWEYDVPDERQDISITHSPWR